MVLLLVTGTGEGDKSSLRPESKCLKGASGTEVEKGKCAEGGEAPGCRPRPSSKWGDGCKSRFQLYVPYRLCDLRRQPLGLSVCICAR